MKALIAILFLSPLFGKAQDTCQLKKETDPFTHETTITTGFIPFTVNGVPLSISIDATKTEIDFFFWMKNESKCFDDASTVQINYEGERLKASFRNGGSMNCEGAFHIKFKNSPATPSILQRLSTKAVSSMKFTGSGNTVTELVFTAEQKQRLLRLASCVVREAKTLIR